MKKINSKDEYEIFCQKCGKKMQMTKGIVTEGIIRLQGKWGYLVKSSKSAEGFSTFPQVSITQMVKIEENAEAETLKPKVSIYTKRKIAQNGLFFLHFLRNWPAWKSLITFCGQIDSFLCTL